MQPNGETSRGRVPGSGRKAGTINRRTQMRLANYEDRLGPGVMPLEVMIKRMRSLWKAGDAAGAFFCAVQAAPYVHSKLSAVVVDQTIKLDPGELSDSQLASIIANGPAGKRQPAEIEHAPGVPNALVELETLAKAVSESDGQA